MFRTVPPSIVGSFSLYTQQWHMSYRFADSLRAGVVRNCSVLLLLASYQQTCMTYTIAVCTVKNSWWCTEELSETCRIYSKNKFKKLVHLFGFIIRIFVLVDEITANFAPSLGLLLLVTACYCSRISNSSHNIVVFWYVSLQHVTYLAALDSIVSGLKRKARSIIWGSHHFLFSLS